MNDSSLIISLATILSVIVGITIHEFAHAWTADRFGDDTPRLMGRLSLSPLAHLDFIGTLMLIFFHFGWGKPVLYNPMRLSKKSDELWIALAGPISNILLAIFVNLLLHFFFTGNQNMIDIIGRLTYINILLAAFNLLPIPPLDGSSIIAYFWPQYRNLMYGQVGLMILVILIFTGVLSQIMYPLMGYISHIVTLFGSIPLLINL